MRATWRSLPREALGAELEKLILTVVMLVLICLLAVFGLVGCLGVPDTAPSKSSRGTHYVSSSSDCAGRRPCYEGLQDAVDAAAQGDIIKVAAGTYTATVSSATSPSPVVTIKKGVCLVGGYHGDDWSRSRSDAPLPIVDAQNVPGRRAFLIDGRGVPTITVRGFRIRRGVDEGSGGGGVHVVGGTVVLEDNVIEACVADTRGGGLFVASGSLLLRANTWRRNVARYGGGLYVDGGTVLLEQNTFVENQAPPSGGTIAIGGGTVTGANNVVARNPLTGAGVYLTGGQLMAHHWTLVNNGRYGVIADLGIDVDRGSIELHKSIIASHQSGLCGAGAVARQTLFHDVNHPCIAGASCVNNLFGDPKFVNPQGGDYHITADSAAVDQGYSLDVARDMDGDLRPVGAASDIGADEIEPERTYIPLILRQVRPRRG